VGEKLYTNNRNNFHNETLVRCWKITEVVVFNVQLHSVYSSVRSDRVILPSNKIEHATLTIRFSLPVCAITKQFMDGFWPNFPGQDILFSQEVKFSDTRRPSHAVCRDQIWHGNGKERSLRSTRPQRKVAAEPQYWGYPYVCQRVWHRDQILHADPKGRGKFFMDPSLLPTLGPGTRSAPILGTSTCAAIPFDLQRPNLASNTATVGTCFRSRPRPKKQGNGTSGSLNLMNTRFTQLGKIYHNEAMEVLSSNSYW